MDAEEARGTRRPAGAMSGQLVDGAGNPLLIASVASAGAAVLHAAACGAHTDHTTLARIFMFLAIAQAAVAMAGFLRPARLTAISLTTVNAGAAAGWLLTRFTGLSNVSGLEAAEAPGVADTAAAILGLVAALSAVLHLLDLTPADPRRGVTSTAVIVAVLVVPGMLDVTSHDHGAHSDSGAPAGHDHADPAGDAAGGAAPADHVHAAPDGAEGAPARPAAIAGPTDDSTGEVPAATATPDDAGHSHAGHIHAADTAATSEPPVEPSSVPEPAWPRPWDPAEPIDFSGVPGVTPEQQARAERLVADTLGDLPAFADVTALPEGYRSIGDARTGYEHYIDLSLLGDDKQLDPTAPESLVYRVDDADDPAARTLVSAMYIARATDPNDPLLTDFGGSLMQWHNHDNLCWGRNSAGDFVVMGVTDDHGGTCPQGQVNAGGEAPMVHVWIVPHECGPFAALEGHGAGQAGQVSATERVDLCAEHHGHGTTDTAARHDHAAARLPVPYDPAKPIDLGGTPGVTPEQQAFAENVVADTVRNLPQWADHRVAEAAGFHSIGDAGTGHEHFIQWDWINDDVWLNPDFPESLVYEPQPDGSRKLVSAMYMLPDTIDLADVPDWGGALMQWHVHADLCFTDEPVAPQVAGTKPVGEPCPRPLVDRGTAPMIHVWITPHTCGPFAALEGVAAGQVEPGDEHLCVGAHGSH